MLLHQLKDRYSDSCTLGLYIFVLSLSHCSCYKDGLIMIQHEQTIEGVLTDITNSHNCTQCTIQKGLISKQLN